MFEAAIVALAFVLAYLNGANDISKGIATLVGSGVVKQRLAIIWGTVATAIGALVAVSIARALVKTFSNGIIADQPVTLAFPIAVAAGAIAWMILATSTGMPVSTTHAITGGLVGAALAQFGFAGIKWPVLLNKIALPLILGPLAAFLLARLMFPLVRRALRGALQYCVCVEVQALQPVQIANSTLALRESMPRLIADREAQCERTIGSPVRMNVVDGLHWLTSGLTSFARGLNDTPKIAAMFFAAPVFTQHASALLLFVFVAVAMVAGSLLGGRKVLHTMSHKITAMDPLEGFTANLGASSLVIGGSLAGLPFSTTHVTTGAIIGIGTHSESGTQWKVVKDILLAWVITLPSAAFVAFWVGELVK